MRNATRVLLSTLVATVAVGALASTAAANRLGLTKSAFRIAWAALEFATSTSTAVRCPVTLEGSFHSRTLSKVSEQLIGYITRAGVTEASCVGGKVRFSTLSLPWHIRYDSFGGTLPSIVEVRFRIVEFEYLVEEPPFVNCLYRSTSASPIKGSADLNASREIVRFVPSAAARIPLFVSLGGICESTATLKENAGEMTVLGATSKITITLVQ